jgi:hypothetical protein
MNTQIIKYKLYNMLFSGVINLKEYLQAISEIKRNKS